MILVFAGMFINETTLFVNKFLSGCNSNAISFFQKSLGTTSDCIVQQHDYVQTGISIINAKRIVNLDPVKEKFLILNDKRIGLNLNTKDDYNLLGSI